MRSLGPQVVLAAIPLQVCLVAFNGYFQIFVLKYSINFGNFSQTSGGEVDLKRSWLLPVLKDCTNNSSLAYFIDNLLPLAESCE